MAFHTAKCKLFFCIKEAALSFAFTVTYEPQQNANKYIQQHFMLLDHYTQLHHMQIQAFVCYCYILPYVTEVHCSVCQQLVPVLFWHPNLHNYLNNFSIIRYSGMIKNITRFCNKGPSLVPFCITPCVYTHHTKPSVNKITVSITISCISIVCCIN